MGTDVLRFELIGVGGRENQNFTQIASRCADNIFYEFLR